MSIALEDLPYRPCAGIMLANVQGKIFVGQRLDSPVGTDAWQMPQGGIDDGEDAEAAALRELFEETGVSADLVDILARSRDEHFYDLPDDMIGRIWKGKYRGQRQHWFLMRFKGTDADINIETSHQEFSKWQWIDAQQLPQLIVPFKKRLYENILAEFADLI
jgi:putative (di)nucleoside polyphosphate hydrolase